MPFVDSLELADILGEAHTTIHRWLTGLLADGIVRRVNHGTAYLPSSRRYYLTAEGISEATDILGFEAPADFVRAIQSGSRTIATDHQGRISEKRSPRRRKLHLWARRADELGRRRR